MTNYTKQIKDTLDDASRDVANVLKNNDVDEMRDLILALYGLTMQLSTVVMMKEEEESK